MTPRAKRLTALLIVSSILGGGYAVWIKARKAESETEAIFARGISEIPFASTRGHVVDGKVQSGFDAYAYERHGAMPGFDGVGPAQDILIVVHGLNNTPTKALNRFALARESLANCGYKGVVVGFSWDGATNMDPFGATGYRFAKHNAAANGKKLAQFVADLGSANPGVSIRLLGYSMGARAIAESLYALNSDVKFGGSSIQLASAHLVGAAIDDEHLQTNERFGKAIENRCVQFFNYYSPKDSKLGKYFPVLEGDRSVGRSDLEEPEFAPRNYLSRNVEKELRAVDSAGNVDPNGELGRNHSAYLGIRNNEGEWVDDGAMDLVFRDMQSIAR